MDQTTTSMKSGLDKIEQVAKILSLVALPMILTVAGWQIQVGLQRREQRADEMKMAISILTAPRPKDQADEDKLLRQWALERLDEHGIKLPSDAKKKLSTGELSLPAASPTVEAWRRAFPGLSGVTKSPYEAVSPRSP